MLKMHLLAALALSIAAAAPQIDAGKITRIDGPTQTEVVSVKSSMGQMSAGTGDGVYVGDTITTTPHQSVVLTLTDESELVLAPSSELTVRKMPTRVDRSTTLGLLYGVVHALVKVYSAEQPFVIKRPPPQWRARAPRSSSNTTRPGTVGNGRVGRRWATSSCRRGSAVGAGMMSQLIPGMSVADAPKLFDRGQFFTFCVSPRFSTPANWRSCGSTRRESTSRPKLSCQRSSARGRTPELVPQDRESLKGLFGR